MSISTIIDTLMAFMGLLRRFARGDKRAEQKLKDILPQRTYTALVRERERARDRAKYVG